MHQGSLSSLLYMALYSILRFIDFTWSMSVFNWIGRIKMHTGRSPRRTQSDNQRVKCQMNHSKVQRSWLAQLDGKSVAPLRFNRNEKGIAITQFFGFFRYNAPVNYRPPAVSPRFQPEYRPQYRSQYTPQYQGQQLQSAYPSSAIPAWRTCHDQHRRQCWIGILHS